MRNWSGRSGMTAVGDSTPAREDIRTVDDAVAGSSRLLTWLVRGVGISSALRIAPGWLLPERELTVTGTGPGWVRLRHPNPPSETRAACIVRQGTLLALPLRFGLVVPILAEKQCVAWGDPACEYVLHHRAAPRWAIVAVAPLAALGCAIVGAAGLAPLTALGIVGATIA